MQVRITAGRLGGRIVRLPELGIRPTKDMVRQALFSALGPRVAGASVLDLFAGSGALGLEAWSRGARHVCWVEQNARVLAALRASVRGLLGDAAESAEVVRADAVRFLSGYAGEPFDIVLADPPYDRDSSRRWLEKTLQALEGGPIFSRSGILVFEMGSTESPVEAPAWTLARDRRYGDTRLLFYERSGPEAGA
jgi:16S rRNA (guanine966-N2)-methyltransferase